MNSRHLETLLWVVRLGGIGAAARHLNLTQPAVTRRVQELEREIGVPLFRKEGRTVVPTTACENCLVSAERVVAEVTRIRSVVRGHNFSGTVRIGIAEFVALTWFPNLLNRIEEHFPDMRIEVDVDLSSRLLLKLKRRHLQLVMVPGHVSVPGLIKTDLGSCQFSWMGHPRFQQGREAFTPAALAELPIVTQPPEANVHNLVMDWFAEAGVTPKRLHYCNSFSLITSLVRKGVGVSLMQPTLFANEVEAGGLVVLEGNLALPKINYTAAYLPSDMSPLLSELVAFARDESWFLRRSKAGWM